MGATPTITALGRGGARGNGPVGGPSRRVQTAEEKRRMAINWERGQALRRHDESASSMQAGAALTASAYTGACLPCALPWGSAAIWQAGDPERFFAVLAF